MQILLKRDPISYPTNIKIYLKKEIHGMLKDGIIYPVDWSEWASPMVAQPKKHDPKKLRVRVDFWWLNQVTLTDPFPTPLTNEIINEVAGHECYSFTNRFSWYNQVPKSKEDQHKTTFVCEFGIFTYRIMPFGLKNSLDVFSKIVIKAFQEYHYKTMIFYFDN